LENTIRQRVPGAAGVAAASAFIPLICEQVRQAIATRLPQEASPSSVAGTVMGAVGTVAQGVGDVVASVGDILFKVREGGRRRADDPRAIRAQLGAGHALDGRLRSGMGAAFNHDFSGVRVHTDAGAARLADKLNARAFTYGRDIAFGTGEYRPGTLIGDALIAHELAHVVQQSGGGSTPLPASMDAASEKAFENDADTAAVGAMMSLWARAQGGMMKIAQNAVPTLRSGLRLRRCGGGKSTPTTSSATPSATPSAAPDAGVPPPETLDEFVKKHSKQEAINKAADEMGVERDMLDGKQMHYASVLDGFGHTVPPHAKVKVGPNKWKILDNELPRTEIGEQAFTGRPLGWPLLKTTVFHEFQHVKQDLHKPGMLGQTEASGEVEAYCLEIIEADRLNFKDEKEVTAQARERGRREKEPPPAEKLTVPEYMEKNVWRLLTKFWRSITDTKEKTKLSGLIDRAKKAFHNITGKDPPPLG
jgi:uncharacterized protein DUF4157